MIRAEARLASFDFVVFSFFGDDEGVEVTAVSFFVSIRIGSTSVDDSLVSCADVGEGERFDLEVTSVGEDAEVDSSLTAVAALSPFLPMAGVGSPFFCLNIDPNLTSFSFHASRISSARKMPSCRTRKQSVSILHI